MKYLKLILSVFLLSFVFSFKVSASSLPTLSTATFDLVENGQNLVLSQPFYSYGVYPAVVRDTVRVLALALGGDVSLQSSDFTIRPLSDVEMENLSYSEFSHFYDNDGNLIPLNEVYYAVAENQYTKCELYIDSNGNILSEDAQRNSLLMNVGTTHDLQLQAAYQQVANEVKQGNYTYYPENVPTNPNTYFIWAGQTAGGVPARAGYLIIQNQWIPGQIQPIDNSGVIYQWYCNDLDLLQWGSTLGTYKIFTTQTGTWNVSGYTYHYKVTADNLMHVGNLGNYDDWINGRSYDRVFGRQGLEYANLSTPENSIGFKKVVVPEESVIELGEDYSINDLQGLSTSGKPSVNPNFDPHSKISESNFPFTYPSPSLPVRPSPLPLPGSDPDISPVPDLSPDDILEPGSDPILPSSIPFLDNLQTRFPFSIPWDIKRMLQTLQASPVAPSFEISWYIAPINYTWQFSLDLSEFSTIASIFRTLFLISFIIGLAIFSYNHFFGS